MIERIIDIDKWQEVLQSLSRHWFRTLLTAFGVSWGIFMLIVLMGAGNGLRNGVVRNFDISKNAVFVWTEATSKPYKGFQPGRFLFLTNEDYTAIQQSIPEAEVVSPRNTMRGSQVTRNDERVSFTIFGDFPTFTKIKSIQLSSGRFINPIDIDKKRKICIIGERVVETLFKSDEDPIGQYVEIQGIPFKVVGITKTVTKGEDAIEDQQSIFIPHSTMQKAFNQGNKIWYFGLIPKAGVTAEELETKVKSLLAMRKNVHPDDKAAFASFNVEKEFLQIQGLFSGIKAVSWLVSVMTILAGVVGVSNIMLITIKERSKEFGIRKSIGAKPWSIISMITTEALVITGFSGYFGLLFGVLVVEGINTALVTFDAESGFFANPEINFQIAALAIGILILSGTISGLVTGLKAARVDPMYALREE